MPHYIRIDRTHKAFETWLKKGAKGTEYILPTETLVMTNVLVDFKNQVIFYCLIVIITVRRFVTIVDML